MDLDIFDIIEDATRENNSFENHPINEYSLEEQLLYLQGLALVMNADNDIHEDEKEYLRILIKSFDMDQSSLEALVEFAISPDKDTVQAFFKTFRRKPIAQLFLFDALMMTRRDNQVHDKETRVVDKIAEQLEILKGTQRDIYDLFCHIKNKDWNESALYFSSQLLNPEHFKHLLNYFEVDFEELMTRTTSLREARLREVIASKLNLAKWDWIPLKYTTDGLLPEATEITADLVNLKDIITNSDIILPYLQSKLDRGELSVSAESNLFTNQNNQEQKIGPCSHLGVTYDHESRSFALNPSKNEAEHLEQLSSVIAILANGHPEIIDVNQFNQVLEFITGIKDVQIAYSKRYSSGDSDCCFPQTKDNSYLNEEVLYSYSGALIISDGNEYARYLTPCDLTYNQLLFSGQFRLIR
ncbi:TerB family tellurite resistance protein [Shewanella mesophila]|uniref:TerB family tellurite resistance protein n=1 Tax=Shewanella mesophila TaxID=2864208 RepID=UPI001C6594D9|nr:TerB family tellurite resistance protein [Shewanella mesophila]QYJ85856.1 TerB family tellurite resistance protein [Shewanella mesophila]